MLDNSYLINLLLGKGTDAQGLKGYLEQFDCKALVTSGVIGEGRWKLGKDLPLQQKLKACSVNNPLAAYDELIDGLCVKVNPDCRPYERHVKSLYKEAKRRYKRRIREMSICRSEKMREKAEREMRTDPSYIWLQHKLFGEPPSDVDMRLVAEAAALRCEYPTFYLISNDQAMVSVWNGRDHVLTTLIPDMIRERFDVIAARDIDVAPLLFERESNGAQR